MKISLIVLALLAAGYQSKIPDGPKGESTITTSSTANNIDTQNQAKLAARRFSMEPSAQEVMAAASKLAKVTPQHIDALNRASRLRAILPTVSAQYGYGWHEQVGTLIDGMLGMNSESKEAYGGWGVIVGGTWDLSNLVFNPAELQSYAVHGMRANILKEVSHTFYARRQAIIQYMSQNFTDEMAKLAALQRIDEYTAILDGLTGNYFSQEMERRGVEPLR